MKDEFKGITPEKFKKYKKGQLGSWQKFNNKTDAGNVELNTQIFNNAATPQASPNTSPVGGGMGESLIKEDTGSEYGKFNDIIKKIKSLSDEEILKYTDTGLSEGPNFITKNGTFVSGSSTDDDTHLEVLSGIIDRIGYEVYGDAEYDLDEDAFIYQELVALILDHIESERGWIRVNTGSEYTGDTPYIYLNKERPTSAQFDAIEEVLEACESNGYSEFVVYISTSSFHATSKVYPLEDYDSIEDILKNIKRYYASGVLYETVEPQEQLFTEEDVNYFNDWIVDVIDYDIKSTEIELGDGRYVVYTEKERDGGHLFEVVDELNNEYIGSDTTYGKVEPIVCVMERVANSIAKNIITMIQKYDNSLIGDSTLRQIKEKCMKSIDKDIDDVLILEQVGGYDAIACEFDKKKNSLRVYSIENPAIDLYRGKLK